MWLLALSLRLSVLEEELKKEEEDVEEEEGRRSFVDCISLLHTHAHQLQHHHHRDDKHDRGKPLKGKRHRRSSSHAFVEAEARQAGNEQNDR